MDVGFLFLILLLVFKADQKYIKLCKFDYENCKWTYRYGWKCSTSPFYCNKAIQCDERTTINIKTVNYGTNYFYVESKFCPAQCYSDFTYSQTHTIEIRAFCNKKQVCDLSRWNWYTDWRLHVIYDCQERIYHRYTRKMNTTSVKPRTEATSTQVPTTRPQPPQTTTSSNDASTVTESKTDEKKYLDTRPVKSQTEATKTQVPTTSPRVSQTTKSSTDASRVTESATKENIKPDQFPVPTVAASVSAGIIVLVIIFIVVICMKRRRRSIKSDHPIENTLQMQTVANNNMGNATTSVHRDDHQETDEHEYVDTALQNDTHTTDGTFEHEYDLLNENKVVNKDSNDEYNTLNTHPTPLRVDSNYDHIPKGSHTTVDDTYSHITDGQTTMPDATYSHLKDTKPAASRNAKGNHLNSDNVYNHINTKSVEENVYNNSQTSFNRSSLSHLGENKAAEDDYDHTDWKQTNTSNSKSKDSNNEAVGKLETKNITERARDEYAVVKKRSDNVESSARHNYFVLEKQFV